MSKKIISVILAAVMIIGAFAVCTSADDAKTLRFDKNGQFKIMHISDCQDGYPASKTMLKFIDLALKKEKPDLVVLGGDNTVCGYSDSELEGLDEAQKKAKITKLKEDAINELVSVFVENETYFTLVFGNHDHQQGLTNDELFPIYQKFGGEYCLAYDAVPELTGCGTHNLPVYGSNDDEIKFNVYLFDSNAYSFDENGNEMGYDAVHEDQINWYKSVRDDLKEETGKYVPSVAFQHIVVGEVYDKLFFEIPFAGVQKFNGKEYSIFPKTSAFTGHLLEFPCPGYYNYGQFAASAEKGDMIGMFFGHDHTNSYEVVIDDVRLINTPAPTHNSYSSELNSGCRVITVNEKDPSVFETYLLTENDMAIENSEFSDMLGRSPFAAKFFKFIGDFLLALSNLSGLFIFFAK